MPRKPASTIPADANDPEVPADFGMRVVHWQRAHGRHDLPWQNTRDPYRIWLSEIMLQQTQVSAVIDYYQRFMASLPTVEALAAAPADEVMALWAGLGYYSRARNLHACARQVVAEHQGRFPTDPAVLVTLPGIGRSTAAAIAAFSAGVRTPILDGNVKRVFARFFGLHGHPGERAVEACMWRLADAALPPAGAEQARDMVSYTQGLMDLGATICSRGRPACLADVSACPLADGCVARRDGLTGVLPSPKPRAAQPERSTVMVMLRRGREILLTLRPGSGIWGGLWSLPELPVEQVPFDAEQAEDAALAYAHGHGTPSRAVFSGELTHVFTHFRLLIRAVRVDMAAPAVRDGDGPAEAAAPAWRWVALDQLDGVGVPAPVRKLLLAQAAPGLF
ncbi:A/G-specific adenine glycosylase [Cupriavidus sp. USMAA2-4]|uniref:Adenine DNA glycosylase n=1 Tax=Cupriavidus malaysiensis TaxID=367825 RepID=A0ABM6F0W4_9BURK|nr:MULTISPECIES: A/G-specific adenine glycosylase [Cupriavidus]AOY91857.1 A/G-specific adenine glycosylase [Cupriavidus sp. USMAA2-4]AOY98584.1 A/G-specific adenine glycosylase [Cupriavidus sp. USMAHM13]AOZ05014.1 A/G-specific adenine glycosylase [Cupriavidus malaysiensis]